MGYGVAFMGMGSAPAAHVATTIQTRGWGSASPWTITFSTAGTSRLLILAVQALDYGARTYGTPTSANLTWTLINTSRLNAAANYPHTRLYWAWASSQLTSEVVSVTIDNTSTDGFMSVSEYSNAKSFAGLTADVDYGTGVSTTTAASSISVSVTVKASRSLVHVSATEDTATSLTMTGGSGMTVSGYYGNTGAPTGGFVAARSTSPPATGAGSFGVNSTVTANWAAAAVEILGA